MKLNLKKFSNNIAGELDKLDILDIILIALAAGSSILIISLLSHL